MSFLDVAQVTQYRPTIAQISLPALRSNFRCLQKLVSKGELFCPMVKANAYGHGLIPVAKALVNEGAEFLGVALIEEGIQLRKAGLNQVNILVFCNFDPSGAEAMIEHRLTPVLSQWDELKSLSSQARGKISVHLKFDTGMVRLGFDPSAAEALKQEIAANEKLNLEGVCSHFVEGEDWQGSLVGKQLKQFDELCAKFNHGVKYRHILNSAALVGQSLCNDSPVLYGARPGIALYGVDPRIKLKSGIDTVSPQLKPVLRLVSKISQCHKINSGRGVSYNHRWKASKDSIIGLVPIGYGDGYLRYAGNRADVLVGGKRAPIRGIVCMDSLLIDVTEIYANPEEALGQEVVLIGEQQKENISARELADLLDTIPYEITTALSSRVPRQYLDKEGLYAS